MIYSKEKKYYFNQGDENFVIVNKKNLLKEFSDKKNFIENYLKENEIDFNSEEDLKILFGYLAKN